MNQIELSTQNCSSSELSISSKREHAEARDPENTTIVYDMRVQLILSVRGSLGGRRRLKYEFSKTNEVIPSQRQRNRPTPSVWNVDEMYSATIDTPASLNGRNMYCYCHSIVARGMRSEHRLKSARPRTAALPYASARALDPKHLWM